MLARDLLPLGVCDEFMDTQSLDEGISVLPHPDRQPGRPRDSEPQVGFMLYHVPVQRLPEAQEHGPVQVAPVVAELQHRDVPLLHVGVQADFVILEMEGFNFGKYVNW